MTPSRSHHRRRSDGSSPTPPRTGAAVGTTVITAFTVLAVLTVVLLRGEDAAAPSSPSSTAPSSTTASSGASPTPTAPADIHLTIGYGGDILTHMPVIADTADAQGDIGPLTAAAAPWIEGVDLALCGMEVPVSPTGRASGYPLFAAPPGLVPSLGEAGWDGCATASNHSWDQGMEGVTATGRALSAHGLGYSGTNLSEQAAAAPYQLYELQREGSTITVAQLSSTYGLNGMSADPPWAVNLNDVDWVADQARAARRAGADIVVLHSQLGEEYSPTPVTAQTDYARAVAATGEVDVLFGAHPHVPQTHELLPGGPGGNGMWASYSAGNFLSNQSEANGTPLTSSTGLFVWVELTVSTGAHGHRSVLVDALHWHAFTVDNAGGHRLIDLAAARGVLPQGCALSAEEIARRREAVMSTVDNSTYSDEAPIPTGAEPVALPRA